jgi:hypothetical protein
MHRSLVPQQHFSQHFSWIGVRLEKHFTKNRIRVMRIEMKKWIVLAALASPLALAGCSHNNYAYAPPPPAVMDDAAQRGYHDGFEAARRDVAQQRPPDMRRHPNFRNPPVPPPAIEDYRHAFRSGYDAFLHNGPPPERRGQNPPPPPPPPPPSEYR